MILTITPNSSLDRVFLIEEWTPGVTMRIDKTITAVGGKGLDTSVSLSCQGIQSTALAFVAGEVGRELAGILTAYGIEMIPIWVNGETRVSYVVVEQKHKRHTHLTAGMMTVAPMHLEAFFEQLETQLGRASWLVSGGSLPHNLDTRFLAQVIERSAASGVPSLVDTSAVPIEPILQARPTILKLNRQEFESAFDLHLPSTEAMLSEGARIMAFYQLSNLVITCGADGLYALTHDGVYHAQAPRQVPVNAAGAGDSVSGTIPHYLSQGAGWADALRRAAAVSAATVLTEATAECYMTDVEEIIQDVIVTRLS